MANHSGMGAVPHAMGVTFRVWAPHAEKVYLIGAFNGWVTKDIGAGGAGFKAQWDFEFVHPVNRGNFFSG